MHPFFYGLAAFTLWQCCYAIVDDKGNHNLEPITLSEWGLQRRDTTTVGLQNQTSVFWGELTNSCKSLGLRDDG